MHHSSRGPRKSPCRSLARPGDDAPSYARQLRSVCIALGVAMVISRMTVAADRADRPHRSRTMAGWTVHVDEKLLAGPQAAIGVDALERLHDRLADVVSVMPADKLPLLQAVPIWLDCDHPLERMQYHPSAAWLETNGYDPAMEKGVHIPQAAGLLQEARGGHQPWAILHELAHAYHDRELGFEEPIIQAAFQRAQASGRYESVLRIGGREERHYALSNHKEFFAEMTEAYFGTNDFYPFVSAELRVSDPETFAMLTGIWGTPR